MLNVLFSTTRQWNIGDEFILFGAINLLKSAFPGEGINPIIYNRHPDLRTDLSPICNLKDVKLFGADELTMLADANYRVGFRDNSFKTSLDGQFLDLVVLAGTPEWSNNRCLDLYEIIEKFSLPVIALGIGNRMQEQHELILRNMNMFKLFTVRSPELIDTVKDYLDVIPQYLPCPSLCSSSPEKIRTVESVKNIGLIYSCNEMRSEINNCVSTLTYEYLLQLFHELKNNYPEYKFSLVCHYVDELPYAYGDFPDMDILYSFDSKDYYEIYSRFDLVIGARVHGIGCAASLGIPGICLAHDFRGETVNGFFAEKISVHLPMTSALEIFEFTVSSIKDKSKRLLKHIFKTAEQYKALLSSIKLSPKKSIGYPPLRPPLRNIFDGRSNLFESMRELRCIPAPQIKDLNEKIDGLERSNSQKSSFIENQTARLNEQNSVIETQTARLSEQNAVIEDQTARLNEQNSVIETQTARLSEQNAVIEDQAARLSEQNAVIEDQAARLNEQNSVIKTQTARLSEQNAVIEDQTARLNEQNSVIETQTARLSEQNVLIENLIANLNAQNATLQSYFNSRSWKVTAPMRKIMALLRRLFKGDKST